MAHGSNAKFNENPLDILDWDEFAYLVPAVEKQGAKAFLPNELKTLAALKELAQSMSVEGSDADDSNMPTPYTYLGQFIDHDITQTVAVNADINPDLMIGKPDFKPISRAVAPLVVCNQRTSGFDLDCLYGLSPEAGNKNGELSVPFDGDRFRLGKTFASGNRPPHSAQPEKDGIDGDDLPRFMAGDPTSGNSNQVPKRALIGDHRNDENLIVAQLHLAMLRFHNVLVKEGNSFDDARRLVTHHYQWIVLRDFLPRICDKSVVDSVLQKGNRLYRPNGQEKFMPFEFAVAAYRFGHSMVRTGYDFNLNFKRKDGVIFTAGLDLLFKFTGLSGDLDNNATLPENWIIDWEMMFNHPALKIDTNLTPILAKLPKADKPVNVMEFLALRNLLKGYLFSLPTGQALALATLPKADRLTAAEIKKGCRSGSNQWTVLQKHGFDKRTPLWFYILAEAKSRANGNHLGPLGSLIVAETVIGLMRANPNSILNVPFVPTLGQTPSSFDLQDLLIKSGLMPKRA